MAYRAGQVNVPHALAADLGPGHFHAALITDDTLVADALVFTAGALKILGGAENALTKKAVALWFKSAVVYSFGFGDFTIRPAFYLIR